MLSKNVNNKKCASRFVFFNENKIQKDSDDFWRRKLILKVRFWHFLMPPHYTNLQNSMISFNYSWFLSPPWKLHNRYCHSVHLHCVIALLCSASHLGQSKVQFYGVSWSKLERVKHLKALIVNKTLWITQL